MINQVVNQAVNQELTLPATKPQQVRITSLQHKATNQTIHQTIKLAIKV